MLRDAAVPARLAPTELTESERDELIRLARGAIGAVLGLTEKPPLLVRTRNLLEPGGAFVTLYVDGRLRGCIGTVHEEAETSLYETVMRTARGAAFEDPRFPPLTAPEWHRLRVEISRLGRAQKSAPEQVVVGLHGVQITRGPARALLLPQVASRRDWTSERLLRELCRKAGLAEDAWQDAESELMIFTAEVFGSDPLV